VDEATKDRRLQEVQALLREQQIAFNASRAGLTLPVLFTGAGRQPGQISGRTPWLQPVHVSGPSAFIGLTAPVFIVEGNPGSLAGKFIEAPSEQEKSAA